MNNFIRLNFVGYNKILDISIDDTLTLKENILAIIDLEELKYDNFYVYDYNKKIFINEDLKISDLNLSTNYILYIF